VHYALALRVQGWMGDLAVRIEHEFFGGDASCSTASSSSTRQAMLAPQSHSIQTTGVQLAAQAVLSEEGVPLDENAHAGSLPQSAAVRDGDPYMQTVRRIISASSPQGLLKPCRGFPRLPWAA
jgi:hypothetical protein